MRVSREFLGEHIGFCLFFSVLEAVRIIVIMGNKRNIQGEHKEKKKPNLLKLVNQKRNKLIDIYQKIYIQQTGLSIRDPGYNRKAGSDRVKALERGWPKPWNQLIPLFDTAIGDANLELGQGVLAAGAAAVGVAPVEPAEVRVVDAAAAVEAVEAVVRDNDTVCDDQPEVQPVSMIADYSDDAVVAAQVAATRAAVAAACEPVDVRDGAVGDVEPVPMDVDEPGASPEAGEVYMDVDESLELLPHPRDVLNAVRAAPGAHEISDVGGSDNVDLDRMLPANSMYVVNSIHEPSITKTVEIVNPSNYEAEAQWAIEHLSNPVELKHGEVVQVLANVTIRLEGTGPTPPPPSPVSNTSIRPDVTGPAPPPTISI